MRAAKGEKVDCLRMILSYGADVDQKDLEGFTAAMHAAMEGNARCLSLLASAGADLSVVSFGGFSAVRLAHMHGRRGVLANNPGVVRKEVDC